MTWSPRYNWQTNEKRFSLSKLHHDLIVRNDFNWQTKTKGINYKWRVWTNTFEAKEKVDNDDIKQYVFWHYVFEKRIEQKCKYLRSPFSSTKKKTIHHHCKTCLNLSQRHVCTQIYLINTKNIFI